MKRRVQVLPAAQGRDALERAALFLIFLVLSGFCFSLWAAPSQAQEGAPRGPALNLIRDAEIEAYLRDLTVPLLRVNGLDPAATQLVIVNDRSLNAFVAGGQNIFFHTGLLEATKTPAQLAGVIAHEIGHIAGGHLIRGKEAVDQAQTQAILGVLLGVMAGLATGDARATAAGAAASQDFALRNFLSYNREQESAADAAALNALDRVGWTSQGLLEFFQKLGGQELLPQTRQSEYLRTHPLTRDRIATVEAHVEERAAKELTLPPEFTERHARMRAKLQGFLQPQTALLRTADADPRLEARYARAIALYRTGKIDAALALCAGLSAEEPHNPYFHELTGQILFENGRVAESLAPYARATELAPDSALIRAAYAHALLEGRKPEDIPPALEQLQRALQIEPESAFAWRLMAMAWGRQGQDALASYALAEEAALRGDAPAATKLAKRAEELLPKDSPYRLRAQDVRMAQQAKQDTDKE